MDPDLIVTNASKSEVAELLEPIAPVVQIDTTEKPLEDERLQFADVVNRSERAQELRGAFDRWAAEVRDAHGDVRDETTVSFLASWDGGRLFEAIPPTQAYGMVFRALDLPRPEAERDLAPGAFIERSLETVGAHNADVMFQIVFDRERLGSQENEAFLAQPLVQLLPVVKADQVFTIDGKIVGAAWGKAMNGLDQIAEVLLRDDLNRNLVTE
ncbi:MAG: ABC transporter substrate-binding protein [Shimia sp.]